MPPAGKPGTFSVSLATAIGAVLLAFFATVLAASFQAAGWLGVVLIVAKEGPVLLIVLLAAGGLGWTLLLPFAPRGAPFPLRLFTSVGLGLWLLSSAVMVVGTLVPGGLETWRWWLVLVVGCATALGHLRSAARKVAATTAPARKPTLLAAIEQIRVPSALHPAVLLWIIPAVAAGLWVSGVSLPPGFIGLHGDAYDILEYHLQLPREFYNAGQVATLDHNVYSHYPLGVEMLYLLSMSLRGGGYEGTYLAKLMHGATALLAVGALWTSLRRNDSRAGMTGGKAAAIMLATSPFVVYLSWIAMVELAQIFYLTLALLWLREWASEPGWKSAACIGLACGAACATKYLAVGFVAIPVLSMLAGGCLRRPSRLLHLAAAIALTTVLFSPWLIRNFAATGNPVFPLATRTLGRGHWDQQSEARWVAGHSATPQPPVPTPPDWKPPAPTPRLQLLWKNFLNPASLSWFSTAGICAAIFGAGVAVAGAARRSAWALAVAGVAIIQVGVWIAFTRGMPPRFLVPILVPTSLLTGVLVSWLLGHAQRRVHRALAWLIPLFVALTGLLTAGALYPRAAAGVDFRGLELSAVATEAQPWRLAWELPDESRVLLVGSATPLYYPPDTLYATAFDLHPLADMYGRGLSGRQMLTELRARGITHLWVDHVEIRRLRYTYGLPEAFAGPKPFSDETFARKMAEVATFAGELRVLQPLLRVGMKPVHRVRAGGEENDPNQAGLRPPLWTVYALPAGPVDDPPEDHDGHHHPDHDHGRPQTQDPKPHAPGEPDGHE